MQQYRVEFFNRSLDYVYHEFTTDMQIDDDYIAIQTTSIDIAPTQSVKAGYFIRVLRDEQDYFFGLVTNASPGEERTIVEFKPFMALFDVDILFNTNYQGRTELNRSLENTLKKYITETFISNSDSLQNLPLTVSVPSEEANHTKKWGMNIKSDTEGAARAIIGLYEILIVNALKKYGVAIRVDPDFAAKTINLTISKVGGNLLVDGDLDNILVKTFKVNDRPNGVNKLMIYNSSDYSEYLTFYVHPDHSWDSSNSNRITPVVCSIKATGPDTSLDPAFAYLWAQANGIPWDSRYDPTSQDRDKQLDPHVAYIWAALNDAYDELSGLEWDNLIELECAPNDPLVSPQQLRMGQKVTVYYKNGAYTSILTGRNITLETVTLIFGSERIAYTKLRNKKVKG